MLCFLGLQLGLKKPVTAQKVFLVNNSPILSMLLHEKISKVGNEGIGFVASGVDQPATREEKQKVKDLFKADEPAEPTSGAEEQEINYPPEKREYDDSSDGSTTDSGYTPAASILNRVIFAGDEPALANFANFNFDSESEDPIPPEYKATTEFLRKALAQFPIPPDPIQSKFDAAPNIRADLPGLLPPQLNEKNLKEHNKVTGLPAVSFPPPYSYMANHNHANPDFIPINHSGAPMECWDGCPDCEVYPSDFESRIFKVYAWFEKHFTHDDVYWNDFGKNPSHSSLKHPELDPDDADIGNLVIVKRDHDDDFLLGAEGVDDFPVWRTLWYNDPEDVGQNPCTLLVQFMQLGEKWDPGWEYNLCYYHGDRSNAIMAEYEPRFLPNVGCSNSGRKLHILQYPGIDDMNVPIWEARGCPVPMQGDYKTRMEYAKMEYNRQWLMYHAQDDARRRYLQQVVEAARGETLWRGLSV